MDQSSPSIEDLDAACAAAFRALCKTRRGTHHAAEALDAYLAAVRAYDLARAAAMGTEPPVRGQPHLRVGLASAVVR